jgi:hypothetical protein
MNAPEHPSHPPFIDPSMQAHVAWRDDDIVISVPAKSGTTWTMNIVYQLLTGGDADFTDIYGEVPWIELVTRPGMPREEMLDRIERMPRTRPRAFKTHGEPGVLPYLAADASPRVRYVVVMRNPEEALVSMKPFMEQHTDELLAAWGIPRQAIVHADFASYFATTGADLNRSLFAFLAAWWPLRHKRNVLFVHFNDMTRDHAGSVRRIADFLGIRHDDAAWARILEYTSFPWMKRHDVKFDGMSNEIPLLKPGAMVRKGKAGSAHEDGMTPAIAAQVRAVGESICTDAAAVKWFYEGGPLP